MHTRTLTHTHSQLILVSPNQDKYYDVTTKSRPLARLFMSADKVLPLCTTITTSTTSTTTMDVMPVKATASTELLATTQAVLTIIGAIFLAAIIDLTTVKRTRTTAKSLKYMSCLLILVDSIDGAAAGLQIHSLPH